MNMNDIPDIIESSSDKCKSIIGDTGSQIICICVVVDVDLNGVIDDDLYGVVDDDDDDLNGVDDNLNGVDDDLNGVDDDLNGAILHRFLADSPKYIVLL